MLRLMRRPRGKRRSCRHYLHHGQLLSDSLPLSYVEDATHISALQRLCEALHAVHCSTASCLKVWVLQYEVLLSTLSARISASRALARRTPIGMSVCLQWPFSLAAGAKSCQVRLNSRAWFHAIDDDDSGASAKSSLAWGFIGRNSDAKNVDGRFASESTIMLHGTETHVSSFINVPCAGCREYRYPFSRAPITQLLLSD